MTDCKKCKRHEKHIDKLTKTIAILDIEILRLKKELKRLQGEG